MGRNIKHIQAERLLNFRVFHLNSTNFPLKILDTFHVSDKLRSVDTILFKETEIQIMFDLNLI